MGIGNGQRRAGFGRTTDVIVGVRMRKMPSRASVCSSGLDSTADRRQSDPMSSTRAAHASLGFLLLCGALSTFPPVTTDIYLPALPQLTRSLHGTTAEGQTTLAVYFLGLGQGP